MDKKRIFNVQSLREEIIKTWGQLGAHIEVFDQLLEAKSQSTEQSNACIHDWQLVSPNTMACRKCSVVQGSQVSTITISANTTNSIFQQEPHPTGKDIKEAKEIDLQVMCGEIIRIYIDNPLFKSCELIEQKVKEYAQQFQQGKVSEISDEEIEKLASGYVAKLKDDYEAKGLTQQEAIWLLGSASVGFKIGFKQGLASQQTKKK